MVWMCPGQGDESVAIRAQDDGKSSMDAGRAGMKKSSDRVGVARDRAAYLTWDASANCLFIGLYSRKFWSSSSTNLTLAPPPLGSV